ncbi:MAG: OmpA family protein [Enterovibrio sp.]
MENIILFAGLLAMPACAASNPYPHLILGAKAGYQWAVDGSYHHSAPSSSVWGVYSGLQLSPSWSWDIGYQYHDELKADISAVNVKTSLIESALRYDWFLRSNFSLYGRIGATYWNMEKMLPLSQNMRAKGFSPLTELGVNYIFTPNFQVSVGYQYIDSIGKSNTGKYDSYSALINFAYINRTVHVTPAQNTPTTENTSPQIFSKSILVFFENDSAKLRHDLIEQLSKIAEILNNYPQSRVVVVGHTDSIGSKVYNQALSERRAQEVVAQLIKLKVASTQIEWRGEGLLYPVADNKTAEGKAQNRRVEIDILPFQLQK